MRIALVSEGSSDRMLTPFLRWLPRSIDGSRAYELVPIDLRALRRPPQSMEDKLAWLARSDDQWDLPACLRLQTDLAAVLTSLPRA